MDTEPVPKHLVGQVGQQLVVLPARPEVIHRLRPGDKSHLRYVGDGFDLAFDVPGLFLGVTLIPYVLQLVGLDQKADRYPGQLSGGEQQRVAIARALVNNPNMIIADEPTGNLDPSRSLEIMMLLERINELGTTVLVVTHEKNLVNRFGKRVVAIEDGRIINDETGGYYNGEKI